MSCIILNYNIITKQTIFKYIYKYLKFNPLYFHVLDFKIWVILNEQHKSATI